TVVFCSAVGRFHDSWTTARHNGKTHLTQLHTDGTRHHIVWMFFPKPRRTKNCHTRTHKVQDAEAADKFPHYTNDAPEFGSARMRTFQKEPIFVTRWNLVWLLDS